MLSEAIYNELSLFFEQPIEKRNFFLMGGGSINQTFKLKLSDSRVFFCKINSATKFPQLFEKEKNGLELLSSHAVIKTPKTIFYGSKDNYQFLVLEWITSGAKTKKFWSSFGQQLAALHQITHSHFGLHEDNHMGSVKQVNTATASWVDFFIAHRIKPLLNQCFLKKLLPPSNIESFENLFSKLPQIFSPEPAALVHGDLWSGNFMCNEKEESLLIDPAVYFGHRSIDLGMTTLFGGFDNSFYEAYHHHYPFPYNYREQWEVCNLYPLLIHLLLFGKGYLPQIAAILKKYQ